MDGEERVLATAQYIVRSLGTSETMTDDMIEILSKFDHRFSDLLARNSRSNVSSSEPEDDLLAGLKQAEETIQKWEKSPADSSWHGMVWDSEEEAAGYLHAVDEVQSILDSLSLSSGSKNGADHAKALLHRSMVRLENEFRYLLSISSAPLDREALLQTFASSSSVGREVDDTSSQRSFATISYAEDSSEEDEDVPVAQPVTDLNPLIDLLPDEPIKDLHDIAKRMLQAGYKRECCQAFCSIRRAVLEESFHGLGLEQLNAHKMQPEILHAKIRRWIQVLDVGVKVLFASEKQLCDQVFEGLDDMDETCFADYAKGAMMQLLNFGEAVAGSKRSTDKLIDILDMYEKLRDVLPEINSVFSGEACLGIREEAAGVLMRLGEAARGTFSEFELAIQRDPPKDAVPGGALHPLTRYVMNFLRLLLVYVDTLKQLFGERSQAPVIPGETNGHSNQVYRTSYDDQEQGNSPLAVQFIWIIHILGTNLENKAKLYKDLALGYLFLMNNVHYILQKVRRSEIEQLVGSDWIRKQTLQVRQLATSYQRSAWVRVLSFLKDEGIRTGGFSSGVSKAVLKDRFKNFNAAFDEIHKTQSSWCVPDLQLRSELRISITEMLLVAYRAFLGRYKIYLESERQPSKYIKYTLEDLEAMISDLFSGP